MSEHDFDYVITGNSVFSTVLALALASRHGQRVCHLGQIPSDLQILRDIAIGFGPYSRPETLRLLAGARRDLDALLPKGMLKRRDVVFAARDNTAEAGAGHIRQMFAQLGIETASETGSGAWSGFLARGLWGLKPRQLFAEMPTLLAEAGVVAIEDYEDLHIGAERVRLAQKAGFSSAARAIVTDASVASGFASLPNGTAIAGRTALLTEPVAGFEDITLIDVGTGGFMQAMPDGRLEAVASTDDEVEALAWLSAILPAATTHRVVARATYQTLISKDGAPLFAPVSRKAAFVACGFGPSAPFFATALASHITGTANSEQVAYFTARLAGASRAPVADIALVGGGAA